MEASKFSTSQIASIIPKKKALLIAYDHKDMNEQMDAYEARYKHEFDVKKLFIRSKQIKDIALIKGTGIASPSSQKLIDALPDGYRVVFNLFAIEGYKHSEIAKKLKISESTSKSQLFKARKLLQYNYHKMNTRIHENK